MIAEEIDVEALAEEVVATETGRQWTPDHASSILQIYDAVSEAGTAAKLAYTRLDEAIDQLEWTEAERTVLTSVMSRMVYWEGVFSGCVEPLGKTFGHELKAWGYPFNV